MPCGTKEIAAGAAGADVLTNLIGISSTIGAVAFLDHLSIGSIIGAAILAYGLGVGSTIGTVALTAGLGFGSDILPMPKGRRVCRERRMPCLTQGLPPTETV